MKKLKIEITKGQLLSYEVRLEKNFKDVVVSATIGLFTEGGKEITEYCVSTSSWDDNSKFVLPLNAIAPMTELAKILEGVVIKHCKDSQLELPAPKV